MSYNYGRYGRSRSAYTHPKSLSNYAPTRAARMRVARARQRALIRAGRRFQPVTIYRGHRGDLKGMDTQLTIAGPVIATTSTNADAFVLNLVEAGNGYWNRQGNKINLKSLRIKGIAQYTYAPEGTTDNLYEASLRMVVVWDKQPSGALPTWATIFGWSAQDGTEASTIVSNLRFDNTGRFKVLRDITIEGKMNGTPYTGGSENRVLQEHCFDEYIKLKGKQTIFSGDSDPCTIADISTGGLYVFFRANKSLANIYDWSITSNSLARLRFYS